MLNLKYIKYGHNIINSKEKYQNESVTLYDVTIQKGVVPQGGEINRGGGCLLGQVKG